MTLLRPPRLASCLCTAFGLTLAGTALADTQNGPQFNFSGFGTLATTHSNEHEANYRSVVFQPNGPGATSPWKFGVDTKLGAQVSANFGNGLTGIVQVVSDHRGDNSYTPVVEWANLKYAINKNWYVRGGRMLLPTFMVSDTRNIGYAQTAVRMPADLYYLNPITHMDGIDFGASFDIGPGNLSAALKFGKSKDELNSYKLEGRRIANLSLVYDLDESQFHAKYLKAKITIKPFDKNNPGIVATFDAYRQMVALLATVPAYGYSHPNLLLDNLDTSVWSLGYSYDANNWIVQTEYAKRKSAGQLVRATEAAYLLAGYRMNQFTPYLSVSRMRDKTPAAYAPAKFLGTPLDQAAGIVNQIDQIAVFEEQKTFAAGLRYDLARSIALKTQFEVIRKPGSVNRPNAGLFESGTALFKTTDRNIKLFTVAVDFLF